MSFELATFYKMDGSNEVEVLPVHFNPASLRITMNNQFGDNPPEQHCRETTSKLDIELVFDATDTGIDVRFDTDKLEELTRAGPPASAAAGSGGSGSGSGGSGGGSSGAAAQPSLQVPVVVFRWGISRYRGIVESLTQTLDFWSSDGVPLRATVQLALKSASRSGYDYIAISSLTNPAPPPNNVTPATAPAGGTGITDAAQQAGDPRAGRMLAAMNGVEDMRGAAGASVGVSASVSLSAAASFSMSAGASAGAGISAGAGFSAGASAGASVGAGLGASAGIGLSGGAGAGAGVSFGASASAGAGIGFSAGASAGAGIGFSASAGASAGVGASASVSVTSIGGMMTASSASSGSLSAGVSASAGAFAGLGASKMITGSTLIDPGRLLVAPPPLLTGTPSFDVSGRVVGGTGGQVAASYRAQAGVVFS